jgi:hypothetical protein
MILMFIKKAHIRLIINADEKSTAQKILEEIISKVTVAKNSLTELEPYQEAYHYDVSFTVELAADSFSDLEQKAVKLCSTIVNGTWLFVNLPSAENDFEFEAIYNHEAFILPSFEYMNKLKWAHLEIAQ